MIIVKAPLRISFAGGGSDLPNFYRTYPGKVLSATIDKYIYLVIKSTPLVERFIVKYQETESVAHPSELKHDRVREALLKLDLVKEGIEIGSFADLPAKTGLGSSSSFSVALVKGLFAFNGQKLSKESAAAYACDLEINILKEPIGKQDQYAAAYGGFNVFQFNADESVSVEPLLLDYKKRALLESHMLLFFTGITRNAASVLSGQSNTVAEHFETYQKMADSVPLAQEAILAGNIRKLAEIMMEGWKMKKSLAPNVSNSTIDSLFESGIGAGAWGGKILGAGGGGCLLFLAPPHMHAQIRAALSAAAVKNSLDGFQEIPTGFTQSGADVLFNGYNPSLH